MNETPLPQKAETPTPQKKIIGGIGIPKGPPPTLVEAAQNALVAIAAWKLTDDQQPYREIGSDLRAAFRRAHDQLFDALPKRSAASQLIATSVGRGSESDNASVQSESSSVSSSSPEAEVETQSLGNRETG